MRYFTSMKIKRSLFIEKIKIKKTLFMKSIDYKFTLINVFPQPCPQS
ncbi:hypothetical protein XSR1_150071 [Xenorhabdus szentirmaii DSM 16338]|uniref:Uncharacterized protein n=1 Tax=Xenorhabdus szentirmaii DSM 16338 TaxID=1427518 RepID=W1ITA6_9GAMM|nr:hypothetical protein XSR1_150071 [Xenorhabdus szentirmaii DSM 16338]